MTSPSRRTVAKTLALAASAVLPLGSATAQEAKQANEVVGELKAKGMAVTEMPAAELDKIRVAVQPVVDKNAEAIGNDSVQSFYGEVKRFRAAKR